MIKELREEIEKDLFDVYESGVEGLTVNLTDLANRMISIITEQQNTELKEKLEAVVDDKLNLRVDLTDGIKLHFEGLNRSIDLVKKSSYNELKAEVKRLNRLVGNTDTPKAEQ